MKHWHLRKKTKVEADTSGNTMSDSKTDSSDDCRTECSDKLPKMYVPKDYIEEIVRHMKTREETIPLILCQSPQLECRRYLVDWLAIIVEKLNLQNTTLHLAVHLLDRFMDQHDIEQSKIKLVTLGTLLVAAKFEETENRIPRVSDLNKFTTPYPSAKYMKVELILMEFFQWTIMIPTAAHFSDFFTVHSLFPNDCRYGRSLVSYDEVLEKVKRFVKYFLDISLQDAAFLRFPSSLVAAACIASARIVLVISPEWPTDLETATYYKQDSLQPCVKIMLRMLSENTKQQETPKKVDNSEDDDSGCSSGLNSSLDSSNALQNTKDL